MTTDEHTEREKRDNVVRVRVSDSELQWLREQAAADDRSVHYIIRLALRQYLEAHYYGTRA